MGAALDQELSVRGAVAAGAPQLPLTGLAGTFHALWTFVGRPEKQLSWECGPLPSPARSVPRQRTCRGGRGLGAFVSHHCPAGAAFFSSSKPNGGSQAEGPRPPVRPCQLGMEMGLWIPWPRAGPQHMQCPPWVPRPPAAPVEAPSPGSGAPGQPGPPSRMCRVNLRAVGRLRGCSPPHQQGHLLPSLPAAPQWF